MEKRHFTRVLFKTEAIMQYDDRTFRGEVENLSMKGMFFKVQDTIPLNEPVKVKIFLSGASSELAVDVAGKVVRQDKQGVAVKFDNIDMDSFIHLKNVVAYNSGDADQVTAEFHNFMKLNKARQ